jgi:tetratricopeptide (TPR) repeat protein
MGLFGKKKDEAPQTAIAGGASKPPSDGPVATGAFEPEPDKAARFFERAKTVHQTGSHEYAMQLWLQGLRFDPGSMNGLEGYFQSATQHAEKSGGKVSKETAKVFDGKTPVEKFLLTTLAWSMKIKDAALAVKATEGAAALDLAETAFWIGEKALVLARAEPKPRKDNFTRLMDAFAKVGAYDKAAEAGDSAIKIDPTDGELSNRVRNMSAQSTMAKGGFDQTGKAGGFRANVRDLDKQRALEDADRIVKTEETIDRLIATSKQAYETSPGDLAVVGTYAKRLRERGRPEDEETAFRILTQAYEETKQFRFRQEMGELRLRRAARALRKHRENAEASPGNAELADKASQAEAQYRKMEIEEYKLRVDAYPTDLSLKYELGRKHYSAGEYEEAIALLQEAQSDPKIRGVVRGMLAECFLKIGWLDEAIQTYRDAIEIQGDMGSPENMLNLRYGLVVALQEKATKERDAGAASEGFKLASTIAIQQISYRDVRARRETLKALLTELGGKV